MNVALRGGGSLERRREGAGWNWVLIPGGPGMLGDAFDDLVAGWAPGGSVWTLDYCGSTDVEDWKNSLLDLAGRLDHMVIVGHSFGGMLMLMTEALEERFGDGVDGWVFLDSSPNRSWCDASWPRQKDAFPAALAEAERLETELASRPTEDGYRRFFLAYAPYYFQADRLDAGRRFLARCRYHAPAYALADRALSGYDARWVPRKPALVLAGDSDRITPLSCFTDDSRFRGPNFRFASIASAGHFPWIENASAVLDALAGFPKGPKKK